MSPRLPIWVSNTILVCFLFVSIVYTLIAYESKYLKQAYSELPNPYNSSFATIQEITKVKNSYPITYQCHYAFSLQNGILAESAETIPYSIYKKLKLGDPIEIYRKEITLFGRKIALSKIGDNNQTPPLIDNLERYFRGAVAFFAIMAGLAALFRVWGLQFQTYQSQKK